MTVIVGLHRTEAARRAGHEEVLAVAFTGSDIEALALAIKANVGRGKALTRGERRVAASSLLRRAPERSDRWVAEVYGLSHTTVAGVREAVSAQARSVRTGRDGRNNPVDSALGHAAVAKALTANPGKSLRRAARLAGVSSIIARRVAAQLEHLEGQGPDRLPAEGLVGEEPFANILRSAKPRGELSWWKKTDVLPTDNGTHRARRYHPASFCTHRLECRRPGDALPYRDHRMGSYQAPIGHDLCNWPFWPVRHHLREMSERSSSRGRRRSRRYLNRRSTTALTASCRKPGQPDQLPRHNRQAKVGRLQPASRVGRFVATASAPFEQRKVGTQCVRLST